MFNNPNEFSKFIEQMVHQDKTITYVDAILKYCHENKIDPEDIKGLVNKSLKLKMKQDFINMKFLKSDTDSTKL